MPTSAYNKFHVFTQNCAEKVHNLKTDALKIVLTNTAPVATNTVLANITQVAAGNGYVAGGLQATQASSTQTGGVYKLVCNDVVFTAAGGSIGPFRYAVLYNDTPTSPADPLIGWWDYGQSLTINDTETFTVDLDAAAGVFTIT